MNFIFVFDEYTDFADADAVRKMVDIVIDAIRNPEMPRPEGEVLLGEIARQYVLNHRGPIAINPDSQPTCRFWERGIKACTVTTRKHFEEALIACVNSFYNQALDRETNRIHTVETYFEMRRDNIGMRPASIVGIMGIDIPDEAFYHPAVVELHYLIADLIILDNVSSTCYEQQRRLRTITRIYAPTTESKPLAMISAMSLPSSSISSALLSTKQ